MQLVAREVFSVRREILVLVLEFDLVLPLLRKNDVCPPFSYTKKWRNRTRAVHSGDMTLIIQMAAVRR